MSKFSIESTLVVLPARGGSKRIPKKNIIEIFGQPMIYWPLMEINKIFNRENVLVSTDSKLIKECVEKKGLSVPFMRPDNLSDDYTGAEAVVKHALDWYESNVKKVDFVLGIYPTSVLLCEKDILAAITLLNQDLACDLVLSATDFRYPIQRALFENHDGYAEMFDSKYYSVRSQDLIEAKHDAGQFFLYRASSLKNGATLINSKVRLQLLHTSNVIDIDTFEHLEIAEEKLRMKYKNPIDKNWMF